MFCTKCGNELEDGARFCTKCGQNLIESTQEIPVVKPEKRSGAGKTVIILVAVLIAVIIAATGIISYLVLSGKNAPAENGPTAPALRDKAAVTDVLEGYLEALPKAVNTGDYSYIEPYILYGSPLYDMQVSLVDYNYEKGVTERYIGYELEDIDWIDDYTCYVSTDEIYEISFGGDSTINDYEWEYTVVWQDGQYYLTNLRADD